MSIDAISRHEVAVFRAVGAEWITSREVAAKAVVAERTARLHLVTLVRAGLIERAHTFPGYRYRSVMNGAPREHPYLRKLQEAAAVFGA